jgi:hypothetical protein
LDLPLNGLDRNTDHGSERSKQRDLTRIAFSASGRNYPARRIGEASGKRLR